MLVRDVKLAPRSDPPTIPTLGPPTSADRIGSAVHSKYLVAHGADSENSRCLAEGVQRIAVGPAPPSWRTLLPPLLGTPFVTPPLCPPRPITPMLRYFTSGTTARAKLSFIPLRVYPIGHLSTMYVAGSGPATRISTYPRRGWAKHAGRAFCALERRLYLIALTSASSRRVGSLYGLSSIRSLCSARRRTVWRSDPA